MRFPFVSEKILKVDHADGAGSVQLVVWPQDRGCDRDWLLENAEGAVGLLVMLTDKVNCTKSSCPFNRHLNLNR